MVKLSFQVVGAAALVGTAVSTGLDPKFENILGGSKSVDQPKLRGLQVLPFGITIEEALKCNAAKACAASKLQEPVTSLANGQVPPSEFWKGATQTFIDCGFFTCAPDKLTCENYISSLEDGTFYGWVGLDPKYGPDADCIATQLKPLCGHSSSLRQLEDISEKTTSQQACWGGVPCGTDCCYGPTCQCREDGTACYWDC